MKDVLLKKVLPVAMVTLLLIAGCLVLFALPSASVHADSADNGSQEAVVNNNGGFAVGYGAEQNGTIKLGSHGYIAYQIIVLRLREYADVPEYLVTVRSVFVPGAVARVNGEDSFGNYKNKSGYVHITAEQAFDAYEADLYGVRYGGTTARKDYWPTYQEEGVIPASLSAQISSANNETAQWLYTYKDRHGVAASYDLVSNYTFKLSNERNSLLEGDFRLKIDFMLETERLGIGYKDVQSLDLFVGAGLRHEIRPFSNGLK